jgi:hypothetical protein
VADQGFVAGDIHQRGDDGAVALGKRGVGERLGHAGAHLGDRSTETFDLAVDLLRSQRVRLLCNFFREMREGRTDRCPLACRNTVQAAFAVLGCGGYGSRGGVFRRRRCLDATFPL